MKKAVQILFLSAFLLTFMLTKTINVMQDTEEIWKDIPSLQGLYQASNQGRIKSLSRKVWNHQCVITRKERILNQFKLPDGYIQVGLTVPGDKQRRHMVHRLVGMAFHENPLNKEMINHKDGVKSNNNESNLEWVTRSENAIHSFKIGLQCNKGSNHPRHKLNDVDVLTIRERYASGESTTKIFKSGDYKMSYTNIKDIIARRTWTHI